MALMGSTGTLISSFSGFFVQLCFPLLVLLFVVRTQFRFATAVHFDFVSLKDQLTLSYTSQSSWNYLFFFLTIEDLNFRPFVFKNSSVGSVTVFSD